MNECPLCGNGVDELFTCDLCKKQVCEECITRQMVDRDDYIDLCDECCADKYDGGR